MLLFAAVLIICICFLRVTVQADVNLCASVQCRLRIRCLKITKTWRWNSAAAPRSPQRRQRAFSLLRLLRQSRGTRRFLRRCLHLDMLYMRLLLHTEDAARSALLTGALRSIPLCIPALHQRHIRIEVLPDFFQGRSSLQTRCIFHLRLGTIILTAILLMTAYLRRRQLTESEEATLWNILSAN